MALVRAKESFWLPNKQLVSQGVLLDAEHPLAKRHAARFEPVEQSPGFDAPVESATSAPGEKRSTVARNRKPAADKADSEASEDD